MRLLSDIQHGIRQHFFAQHKFGRYPREGMLLPELMQ